ncbi:kinase-like domain-containing protein [Pterulicium gracile]|uniref:Kinase-like domain-containing protein n=1 Tax=Pterulicium gracile TaxID=1884261 RepID=A0A5C3QLP4_9AGAR|nr:kinase-like domain-containing protein [Pterula gracilis]
MVGGAVAKWALETYIPTAPESRVFSPEDPEIDSGVDFTDTLLLGPKCYLKVTGVLGQGAFGKVYRAKEVAGTKEYAVKTMAKQSSSYSAAFQKYEAAMHAHVSDHPNVATLHEVYEDETHLFFLMDLFNGGELYDRIYDDDEHKEVDEKEEATLKKIMLQLIDALDYCHENNIYHRDLKPANILLSRDGEEVNAHLADFGIATSAKESDSVCGTTPYMSPEIHYTKVYGGENNHAASDVWALGIVFTEMLLKNRPWDNAHGYDESFRAYTEDPKYLYRHSRISKEANTILTSMLDLNTVERVSLPKLSEMVQGTDALFRRRKSTLAPPSPVVPVVVLEEEKVSKTLSIREPVLVKEGAVKQKIHQWEKMFRQEAIV